MIRNISLKGIIFGEQVTQNIQTSLYSNVALYDRDTPKHAGQTDREQKQSNQTNGVPNILQEVVINKE